LAQEPVGGSERSLAAWERDLINDDDDAHAEEEVALAKEKVHLNTLALAEQESGAENAVQGARRAESRAKNRVLSLQQQVSDLNSSFSAASADASRLLQEMQVKSNQTAAAFQTAERLAESLEQTKRQYHLTSAAAKAFSEDLHERQNDEAEESHLVQQIHKEVSDFTTHAEHVQSELTEEYLRQAEPRSLDNKQEQQMHAPLAATNTPATHGTPTVQMGGTSASVASLPQDTQILDRNVVKAFHPAGVVVTGKTSKQARVVGKASKTALPVSRAGGQGKHLQSFGKPLPLLATKPRVGSLHVGRPASAVELSHKRNEALASNKEYHGTSIEDAFSHAISSTLGLARWAWSAFFSG